MTDSKRLASLTRVTALAMQNAQAELAALRAREEDLRRKLEQLVADRSKQAELAVARGAATPLAGADLRWHTWVDQRRAAINAELARVMAEIDGCTARLRVAFGRDQAAQMLLKDARAQDKHQARRRATYES